MLFSLSDSHGTVLARVSGAESMERHLPSLRFAGQNAGAARVRASYNSLPFSTFWLHREQASVEDVHRMNLPKA